MKYGCTLPYTTGTPTCPALTEVRQEEDISRTPVAPSTQEIAARDRAGIAQFNCPLSSPLRYVTRCPESIFDISLVDPLSRLAANAVTAASSKRTQPKMNIGQFTPQKLKM